MTLSNGFSDSELRSLVLLRLAVVSLVLGACGGVASSSLGQANRWGLDLGPMSQFQQDVLQDNVLTFAEYEGAVAATVQCLRNEGVDVTDPQYDGRQFTFVYGGTNDPDELDAADEVYGRCYSEYQDMVDVAWTVQSAPSEEEVQTIRDEIGACLRRLGLAVPEHPSQAEIMDVVTNGGTQAFSCMRTY